MKKRLSALLLLLALLTACTVPQETGTETAPTLPTLTPIQEESVEFTFRPGEEAVPVLDARNYGVPRILGPAGSVYAIRFQGNMARDPVYGDLDGDGRKELVYRTPGASNGNNFEVVTAYGLEDGWPIQKGEALLNIGGGKTGLTADGDRVFYTYLGSGQEDAEAARLPVSLEDDRLWFNGGGELPEGLDFVSNRASRYGVSWRKLKQDIGDKILTETKEYLLWKEPGVFYTEAELEGEEGLRSLCTAAVSDDGATVTGLVYWYRNLQDEPGFSSSSVLTLPLVEDPEELVGLTEAELTDQLGEPWFERMRTERYTALCWFTQDGKLLTVQLEDKVVSATLTELPVE